MARKASISSICQYCGISYVARMNTKGKYCTYACFRLARHKVGIQRIPYSCPICGTVRMLKPYHVAGNKQVYCSRACRDQGHRTHGEASYGILTPEYKIWRSMKDRCFNPKNAKYKDYGGRGITMCTAWLENFVNFLADVGRRPSALHTIDRIDNNGSYAPGNCRWITRKEQASNRRNNRFLTLNGVTKFFSTWAADIGISRDKLDYRLKKGLSIEDILASPTNERQKAEQRVRAIRTDYESGIPLDALALKYSQSQGTISRIVHYKTWKNIP
jgi:hypothetical protein